MLTFWDISELRSRGSGHWETSTLQDGCLLIRQLWVCYGHCQSCGLHIHLSNKTTYTYLSNIIFFIIRVKIKQSLVLIVQRAHESLAQCSLIPPDITQAMSVTQWTVYSRSYSCSNGLWRYLKFYLYIMLHSKHTHTHTIWDRQWDTTSCSLRYL